VDLVPLYALSAFLVMILLAVVNSKLKVSLALPHDVAVQGSSLPLYFAQSHREFLDLGLISSHQEWMDRVHQAFGEGEDLYQAGEELRLLSRPGRSLLAAAASCFTFGKDWSPEQLGPALQEEMMRRGWEYPFDLTKIECLEVGYQGRLQVGPWSRQLKFQLPGEVYREANALLEAEGWRVMQFATGNVSHAFALMHLPLARKMFQSELFDLIDPPGGEEVRAEGSPEKWMTWLY
jgi:hypothetical protein